MPARGSRTGGCSYHENLSADFLASELGRGNKQAGWRLVLLSPVIAETPRVPSEVASNFLRHFACDSKVEGTQSKEDVWATTVRNGGNKTSWRRFLDEVTRPMRTGRFIAAESMRDAE